MVRLTVPIPSTGMEAPFAIMMNLPCMGVYASKYVFSWKKWSVVPESVKLIWYVSAWEGWVDFAVDTHVSWMGGRRGGLVISEWHAVSMYSLRVGLLWLLKGGGIPWLVAHSKVKSKSNVTVCSMVLWVEGSNIWVGEARAAKRFWERLDAKSALLGVEAGNWAAGAGAGGAWSGGGITEGKNAWAAVPSCVKEILGSLGGGGICGSVAVRAALVSATTTAS
jgi:hypothetical protein